MKTESYMNTDYDLQEVFAYLDELRESGVTNMWGSPAYLQDEFGMNKEEARDYFFEWMDRDNFHLDSKQHPRKNLA